MIVQSLDEKYMLRAMELAELGRGYVSPNPLVGCVIVYENQIIGEGYHKQFGHNHAEVNAILSVKNEILLADSTMYVTLEPCAHFGKTPPCADLIVEKKLKRVVVGHLDPNPLVAGKGVEKLRIAGIEVVENVLSDLLSQQNEQFFYAFTARKPYFFLKWAETADGFVARENYSSKWISGNWSRIIVHKWRSEYDGIMVGTETALRDNPTLNVRNWTGKNPVRIVIDRYLRLPQDLTMFNDGEPTICYNLFKNESLVDKKLTFVQLTGKDFFEEMLEDLFKKGIHSILVEGGSQLLKLIVDKNAWNKIAQFKAPTFFSKGIPSPKFYGTLKSFEKIGNDVLMLYDV